MLIDPSTPREIELPLPSVVRRTLSHHSSLFAIEWFLNRTAMRNGVQIELSPPVHSNQPGFRWINRLLDVNRESVCAVIKDARFDWDTNKMYGKVRVTGPGRDELIARMAKEQITLVPRALVRADDNSLANLITYDIETTEGVHYV